MIYREYQLEDLDDTIRLLNECFVNHNITKSSFEWKHFDSFFQQKTIAMIAETENQIVGFVCFTPVKLANMNQIDTVWICAVQACHPSYRRRGIVTELTIRCEKVIGSRKTYLGFSNASGLQIDQNSKLIGYQIVGQLRQSVILPTLLYSSFEKFQLTQLCEIKHQLHQNNHIQICKSATFLNWRYNINPKVKYQQIQLEVNSKIICRLVVTTTNYFVEIQDIQIMDQSQIQLALKHFANYYFWKNKKLLKISYLPNQYWNQILPKLKFTKKLETYLTLKTQNKKLLEIENWEVCGGDIL